jgi:hypothetical protein
VINAVLFASLMAVSDGCIIKLDGLSRSHGLILQPHKRVIDPRRVSSEVGPAHVKKMRQTRIDGARHGETDQF